MDVAAPKKTWYQKPENWVNALFLAGIGFVGVNFLDKFLPMLNRVLENTLYTAGLLAVSAVVVFLVLNKDLHKVVWTLWKMGIRKLTELVVTLDPIAIMRGHVEKLKDYYQQIQEALGSLRGQLRRIEHKIAETKSAHEHSMQMAQAARKGKGTKTDFALHARQGDRLEKSALTYQGLANKLKTHIRIMEKIQEASKFMITDIEFTVEQEAEKRKLITESYKAMNASKRILAESKDREMYDLALEHVNNDYFQKLGEIEQFMHDSQHFVSTMDLENNVVEMEAVAKLDEWEKRSEGLTKYRVANDPTEDQIQEQEEREAIANGKGDRQSFADLFEKLD